MSDDTEDKIRNAINFANVWRFDDAIPIVAEIFDRIVDALKRCAQFQQRVAGSD